MWLRGICNKIMKSLRNSIYLFGFIIGLGFFSWQVIKTIKYNNTTQLTFHSPFLLILSFLLMVFTFVIQYLNWKIILEGVGQKLHWLDVTRGYAISSVSRNIPGGIWGYVSRSEWLLRNFGIPFYQSGAASVVEIIVSISSSFLIIGFTSLLTNGIRTRFLVGFSIFIPLVIMILIGRLGSIYEFRIFNRKIPNPIWKFPSKTWLLSNLIFIVQWILYGLVLWLIIKSVTAIPVINGGIVFDLIGAIFAFAFAWCIGFLIPFIPGGLGVRELILSILLVKIFNLSIDMSSAVSIILRIISFIVELLWVGWGLMYTVHLSADNT